MDLERERAVLAPPNPQGSGAETILLRIDEFEYSKTSFERVQIGCPWLTPIGVDAHMLQGWHIQYV